MADEAKLVFELVDRTSGSGTPTAGTGFASGNAPSTGNENNPVDQVNKPGLGDRAGSGSNSHAPKDAPNRGPGDSSTSSTSGTSTTSTPPDTRVSDFARAFREEHISAWDEYQRQADLIFRARQSNLLEDSEYQLGMREARERYQSRLASERSDLHGPQQQAADTLGSAVDNAITRNAAQIVGGNAASASVSALGTFARTAPSLGIPIPDAASIAAAGPALGAATGLSAAVLGVGVAGIGTTVQQMERAVAITRPYSGAVAEAEMNAQMKQIQADLYTNKILGDEAAQYLTLKSDLSIASQRAMDFVAQPLIEGTLKTLAGPGADIEKASRTLTSPQAKFVRDVALYHPGWVIGGLIASFESGFKISPWEVAGRAYDERWKELLAEQSEQIDVFKWFDAQPHKRLPPPFNDFFVPNQDKTGIFDIHGPGLPGPQTL